MPVPVVQAGTTTCPASGTAPQLYQGTLYGQARESIAFSLTFSGGRISGSMGMAMLGTTAATSNPVTGTLNGQRCTFTAGGVMQGAVFDGACNGQTFNGTYNAQGVPMQFMTSLAPGAANAVSTACTATAPAQLAANPPVVPPAPVQAGQTVYCGQITGPQFGATIEPVRIAMAATSNTPSTLTIGNNLPGSGVFYGVPAIAPNFACGVSTGALAFQGTCTPTSIAAYTRSNAAPGYGEIQASTQRCTNPMAALPAPFPAPAPVAPNPPPPVQAVVTPTPPAPIPQPAPKPAQPTHPPGVLYCGTFGNTTTQINGMLQILIYPGAGFSGELSVGQAISNASVSTFGSGTFTAMMGLNGDVNGCSATDSGGLSFYGTCTATEISSTSYSILGLDGKPQIGSFDVTTQGCGG
jgi:hypothetical protein